MTIYRHKSVIYVGFDSHMGGELWRQLLSYFPTACQRAAGWSAAVTAAGFHCGWRLQSAPAITEKRSFRMPFSVGMVTPCCSSSARIPCRFCSCSCSCCCGCWLCCCCCCPAWGGTGTALFARSGTSFYIIRTASRQITQCTKPNKNDNIPNIYR